jgi:hypothetical protein
MYNNILIGVLLCLYLKFILANFLTTQSQTSSSIIVAAPAPNQWSQLLGRGLEPMGRAGQAFSSGPRYKPMWLTPNINIV